MKSYNGKQVTCKYTARPATVVETWYSVAEPRLYLKLDTGHLVPADECYLYEPVRGKKAE